MATKIKHIDASGNERRISSSFVQKHIKNSSGDLFDYYSNSFFDRLKKIAQGSYDKAEDVIEFNPEYPDGFKPYNNMWKYEPVDSKYFFVKMLGEGLTDIQQKEAADIICSVNPFEFTDLRFKEVDLFWGKRGGKDATIAKIFAYQVYKLCCLIDPQKFLGMGVGCAIDLINVSKTGRQAKNVFFKYLRSYVKGTRDLKTGYNWFAKNNFWFDLGTRKFIHQNLKEGESIQKEILDFGRGIACHSLNSERFTGEGLNIILAVIDEVGSMPIPKVLGANTGRDVDIGLYDSLKTTLDATTGYSKLVCVSYKYGKNCAMTVLVNRNKKNPSVFISRKSTFEVRPDFSKDRIKEDYAQQPIKSAMMYEIKDLDTDSDTFYDVQYMIDAAQDVTGKYTVNPFKDKSVIIDDITNIWNNLHDWFIGKEGFTYVAHIDLAKGQTWKGGDAIGMSIGHIQDMRVSLDIKMKAYLRDKMGIVDIEELEGELRTGVVIDLACHIVCTPEDKEVRISDIRKFLINLKLNRKFDFFKITYDGWQSLESVQEFNKYGIESEQLSVDRNPNAYHTEKDLIMMGLFKIYPNRIWDREKKELTDVDDKIDHPEVSSRRMEEDGISNGSKDLSDATSAICFTIIKDAEGNSNPVF